MDFNEEHYNDTIRNDYECQTCGYTPTQRELNRGSCPCCARDRIAAAKLQKEALAAQSGVVNPA